MREETTKAKIKRSIRIPHGITHRGFTAIISMTLIALGVPVWSTTVLRMDLDENVARSEYVVIGEVGEQTHDWIETGGNRFFVTRTTVRVTHAWVGDDTPQTITVLTPGGGSPDGGMTFIPVPAGFPELEAGSELLLMLEPATEGDHVLPGLHQSLYHVVRGERERGADSEPLFVRDKGSARMVTRDGATAPELFVKTTYTLVEMGAALEQAAAKAGKSFHPFPEDGDGATREEVEE